MNIENVPFTLTDWDEVDALTAEGERGWARIKALEQGNLRVRVVEYSPGYLADHWCVKGHAAFVLEGDLVIELESKTKHPMKKGMSFQVSDGIDAHMVFSENGAKVFIVD